VTETTELLARRLWRRLEPLHAVTYFAPESREALKEAGTKGFYMGYFGSRAAPLGPVGAGVVIATFFNFCPRVVHGAVPDAWRLSSPKALLSARLEGVDRCLRRVLGTSSDPAEVVEAAELAEQAVEAASSDAPGRPLFAANAELERPIDAGLRLWQAVTALREHRGDGHVATLAHAGLTGCEALVTAAAAGPVTRQVLQQTRGWTDAEWDDAARSLSDRGWLGTDGELSPKGAAARASIEKDTDRLAAGPYRQLGVERAERLGSIVVKLSREIVAAGLLPPVNPIGLSEIEAS
jgi:hypothetical protein